MIDKEYIERGALIGAIEATEFLTMQDAATTLQLVTEAPAADVEPVVHAHWIREKYHGNLAIFSRCSKCGFQYNASIYDAKTFKSIIEKEYNYCPHCGAHMDERSEEE